jgi:two-component system, sensor histidine kinase PdtaS
VGKQLSSHLSDAGIPGVGRIPYGLHFCHFYHQKQDLIDSLVPFFKAGLENEERCIWVTAPPLPADEALTALTLAFPQAKEAVQAGTIRIMDAQQWYQSVACGDVLRRWLAEEEKALAEGFRGLRITGNTSFLNAESWDAFMKYEHSLNNVMPNRRVIALCSYDLRQCRATDLFEVTRHHQHTLSRSPGSWEIVDRDFGPLGHALES